MEKKTKQIYIVLSQTGTLLSRLVKLFTKKPYNHSSISVDKSLNKMYSFGRKNPYNPFIGVFVEEHINAGTFARFKMTQCKVISLPVSEKQYNLMQEELKKIEDKRDIYKYNVLGLVFAGVKVNIPVKNKFYCSEFVRHVLKQGNVDMKEIPDVVYPTHFLKLDGVKTEYEGLLRKYKI